MVDLADIAEALHREVHADKEPPPLGRCPFHDPEAVISRARRLRPWYFEPEARR